MVVVAKSDESFSVHIHTIEVDGIFVNPPKKHCRSIFSNPLNSNIALMVMLKLRVFPPSAKPLKDFCKPVAHNWVNRDEDSGDVKRK
jgi:hypothetical protein